MTRRLAAAALLSATLLTACTSNDPAPTGRSLAEESPAPQCPTDGTSDVPAECVAGDTGFEVSPAPVDTSGAPATSSALPPVVLERQPMDLVLGGNDQDPTLTTRTFSITVPQGSRLSATVACRGFSELTITSKPASLIDATLPCPQDQATDLTVLDPTLLDAARTYAVTVTAPAPSRWFVALGATTRPAPTS